MKRFFEDSSQAKMLTSDRSYRYAIKHMKRTDAFPVEYELRDYTAKNEYSPALDYQLLDIFTTRKGAEVAKAFGEVRLGHSLAIVAVRIE